MNMLDALPVERDVMTLTTTLTGLTPRRRKTATKPEMTVPRRLESLSKELITPGKFAGLSLDLHSMSALMIAITSYAKMQQRRRFLASSLARRIFDSIPLFGLNPDVVTFNTLMGICFKDGDYEGILDAYRGLVKAGLIPDTFTIAILASSLPSIWEERKLPLPVDFGNRTCDSQAGQVGKVETSSGTSGRRIIDMQLTPGGLLSTTTTAGIQLDEFALDAIIREARKAKDFKTVVEARRRIRAIRKLALPDNAGLT
ncbi:hypothetical protein HDU96_010968 [Phlyctochytrium bullatum]|nr:hypothetical protein HDU96_010968 [Phlyctochytrium bullatum]